MGRKSDLEKHIRESYELIRQFELMQQTSSDPKEKLRVRRDVAEQQDLIRGYLQEYERLCSFTRVNPDQDIAEIAIASGFAFSNTPQSNLSPSPLTLPQLRQLIEDNFSVTELRNLCFDIGADHENLTSYGKSDLARELVRWSEHRGRVNELIEKIRNLRPHLAL
jgi:hypothetical protein